MSASHVESADGPSEFGELIVRSVSMRRLFARAAELARDANHLCISGESGTGKDALARALHRAAERSGPLMSVDCDAAQSSLERELFGRAGSGPGALEVAQSGTLVLDRIAELPPELQERLVRELSTRPLGAPRVIALHRRPLRLEVERSRFSAALYERLASAELALPPLRERRDDISPIASRLLSKIEEAQGLTLAPAGAALLAQHDWPGNVRELRNVIERFVYALRAGEPIARQIAPLLVEGDLPGAPGRVERGSSAAFDPDRSYRAERARFEADFERQYVAWLLERHDYNLSAASRSAEMDRKYLDKLARKHDLKPKR